MTFGLLKNLNHKFKEHDKFFHLYFSALQEKKEYTKPDKVIKNRHV
jgi:hypothetical protein